MPRNECRRARSAAARTRLLAVLTVTALLPLAPALSPAQASVATDITAQVLADADITLNGPSVINLPAGSTTYHGVISGEGTLTVQPATAGGTGTLALTATSTFHLPPAQQTEGYTETQTRVGGCCDWMTRLTNPNPPVFTIAKGVIVDFSATSAAATDFGAVQYIPPGWSNPGAAVNTDNYQIDGELLLDGVADSYWTALGIISGTGSIYQTRGNRNSHVTWIGIQPFQGTVFVGTGIAFGGSHSEFGLPHARALMNLGSLNLSTARTFTNVLSNGRDGSGNVTSGTPVSYGPVVLPEDLYSYHFGDDLNLGPFSLGKTILTGVYSYTDSGDWLNPSLSNPALNFTKLKGDASYRGVNIEGSTVQFGDGTTSKFFLPGTSATTYLALRSGGHLTLDYNGPTSLGQSICGGGLDGACYNSPGVGTVTIAGTPGNHVTAITPQFYNGRTEIGTGATLQLGDGTTGHDSSLLTPASSVGTSADVISDNGLLILDNTSTPITVPAVTGAGALSQAGPAAVTVPAGSGYTGTTTVSAGTLNLAGGSVFPGPFVASGGVLNLAAVSTYTGNAVVDGGTVNLAAGATVTNALTSVGGGTLNVASGATMTSTATKVAGGTLNVADGATMTSGATSVSAGILQLAAGSAYHGDITVTGGSVSLAAGAAYTGNLTVNGGSVDLGDGAAYTGTLTVNGGTVNVGHKAAVNGDITVSGGSLNLGPQARHTGDLTVSSGTVSLASGASHVAAVTTIASGTVHVAPGAKFSSSTTRLGATAVLDLTTGTPALPRLKSATGSSLRFGVVIAVGDAGSSALHGTATSPVLGASFIKQGTGSLTIFGAVGADHGRCPVLAGVLDLATTGVLSCAVDVAPAARLTGSGTVMGNLGVRGSYATAGGSPLQVTGQVRLAGSLVILKSTRPLTRRYVLVQSTLPIAGRFHGLPEGGLVLLGGHRYRISYRSHHARQVTLTRR